VGGPQSDFHVFQIFQLLKCSHSKKIKKLLVPRKPGKNLEKCIKSWGTILVIGQSPNYAWILN
jgi:hypothetical protein